MKRSHGDSPSGITPLAKSHRSKRNSINRGRKRLDFDSQQSSSTSVNPPRAQQFPTWTTDEETLLLEFLARKRSEGNFSQWPSFGNKSLWEDAGKYVTENSTNQPPSCERTGKPYI